MTMRAMFIVGVLYGVYLASFADGAMPPAPSTPPLPVAELIARLDSNDFETREEATLALMDRIEAMPELLIALHSPSAEVRRRAGQIVGVLRPKIAKVQTKRLLVRIQDGEVDRFVDQMVTSPEEVDEKCWDALATLVDRIRARANEEHHTKVLPPQTGKLSRIATPDKIHELDVDRDLTSWKCLASKVTGRKGLVRCVAISQGTVQCESRIADSIVFANGDIRVRESDGHGVGTIHDSIVFCDGTIETTDAARSILIATGTVKISGAKEANVVIIQNGS